MMIASQQRVASTREFRLHQAHGLTYHGGIWLGLHISRKIVARDGGKFMAGSPADGGSQFTARLPTTGGPGARAETA